MSQNSEDRLPELARKTLEEYLRAHKMRRTPERFAILDKVFATDAHFFVDALHESLLMEGFHVSMSTVYATVQLFVEAGLVRRHQFGSQPAQYERIAVKSNHNHIHLVCKMCNRVREVKNPELMKQLTAMRFNSFRCEDVTLYIYGLCPRCRRKK